MRLHLDFGMDAEELKEGYHIMDHTKTCDNQPRIWCLVTQRDDICYSFKFKEDAKGQEVMDEVCDRLGIVEKDYFGLQFTNARGELHWLNMRNRVCRQLNKPEPFSLLFCVKFYVPPHQLLQDSTRRQFFVNVKHDLSVGKYQPNDNSVARLHALLAQAEAGDFRENHISYNPSRSSAWTPEFRSKVIIEHYKLKDMTPAVAEFYCLKEIAELEDYGMEYHLVRSDDTNKNIVFGIGIDCLKVERGTDILRVPYTRLRMATHSGKTVKLDIYTSDSGELESVILRLSSKEAACTLYRSITEHHAFYRCDSVRPALKEQVARDFFDTLLSWWHDGNNTERNYIFDTERTCREAYDHARRILYNFGASTAAAMSTSRECKQKKNKHSNCNIEQLQAKVRDLSEKIYFWQESFNCTVCRDKLVDNVLQCGHLVCSNCSELCELCPLCRTNITSKTKFYLPIDLCYDENRDMKFDANARKTNTGKHSFGDMDIDTNSNAQTAVFLVE